jgi:hypothetical protein
MVNEVMDDEADASAALSQSGSSRQQRVFALHQLPDFLERLVERPAGDVAVDGIDGQAIDASAGKAAAKWLMVNGPLKAAA